MFFPTFCVFSDGYWVFFDGTRKMVVVFFFDGGPRMLGWSILVTASSNTPPLSTGRKVGLIIFDGRGIGESLMSGGRGRRKFDCRYHVGRWLVDGQRLSGGRLVRVGRRELGTRWSARK